MLVVLSWPIVATGVVLIALLMRLAALAGLPSRAIRVRNAWLMQARSADEFAWTPADVPADFRREQRPVTAAIAAAVAAERLAAHLSDWQRAVALVTMLVRHWRQEGAIRADLATTYRGIVEGRGYCSDYVRVYLAAANSIGMFCRQWAFSFDGFGGHGHTFVEVYERDQDRWTFVDVHNNVYAVWQGTDDKLDAMQLRRALLQEIPFEFRRLGPGRLGFEEFDKLLAYYRRGRNHWYLWWGNDVSSREAGGLAGALAKVSGRLGHRAGSALRLPPLVAIKSDANRCDLDRMRRLRSSVAKTLFAVIAVSLLLLGEITWAATQRGTT